MTIHLSRERERFVQSLVEEGQYASEDEVIIEALRLLEAQNDQVRLAALRREIAIGVEQANEGNLHPFDPQATLQRIRSRHATGMGQS